MSLEKRFSLWNTNYLSLTLLWYLSALFSVTLAIVSLVYLTYPRTILDNSSHYQRFQALPSVDFSQNQQTATITKNDGRSLLIKDFFTGFNSPLSQYSDYFVETADRYGLDYRLMPAISMQESNGAKRMPANSHNPFGFGIYGGKVYYFASIPEAIDKVGRTLHEEYQIKGLIYPYQIMTKYTPPSLANGGSWAIGVSTFMDQLQ